MIHVSHVNDGARLDWVMSHICIIWMGYVSHMNKRCHIWMNHVSLSCDIIHVSHHVWLHSLFIIFFSPHMCDRIHICETFFIHVSHNAWHHSLLIPHICVTECTNVWHCSLMCHIVCDIIRYSSFTYVWQNSQMCDIIMSHRHLWICDT